MYNIISRKQYTHSTIIKNYNQQNSIILKELLYSETSKQNDKICITNAFRTKKKSTANLNFEIL